MGTGRVEIVEITVVEQVHQERGAIPEQAAASQRVVQRQGPEDDDDAPDDGNR